MENKMIWAGNPSKISKIDGNAIFDEIPVAIWEPYSTMMGTFVARQEESFKFAHKVYGIEHDFIQHVLTTYQNSEKNVGVLMNGLKGAGKTVTAKMLANLSGLPIILVNASNIEILSYFDNISQPLCFFFDEFEKIVNHDDAKTIAPLLSFVDGTSSATKHLMLFTSNDARISPFFIDRPGRIRYIKQYGSLKGETVKEILDDMLIYPEFKQEIIDWVVYFKNLTIDMLISIIKEVNIHGTSPKAFAHFFNVNNEKASFSVAAKITNTKTGASFSAQNYRLYSDVSVSDFIEDLDDHDRSLIINGTIIYKDDKTQQVAAPAPYEKEYWFYVDRITEEDPYYDAEKPLFRFCPSRFTDLIKDYGSLLVGDDKTVDDFDSGLKVSDLNDLVIEIECISKSNYSNFSF